MILIVVTKIYMKQLWSVWCSSKCCNEEPIHDTGIVILQTCLNSLKSEPGSYSDTRVMASGDGSHILGMDIVEASNVQEDKDPLLMSSVIKVEHEVSCVGRSTFMHVTCMSRIDHSIFGIHICHMKFLHSNGWVKNPRKRVSRILRIRHMNSVN
jgi:hypothetical protein